MNLLDIVLIPSGFMLVTAVGLTGWRMLRGPGLADRAVALDLLGLLAIAATGLIALGSGHLALLDVALGLGLVGFVSVIGLAGFIERAGARAAKGASHG
jgi:multisubunit Na+/H+ antiporter MnhF subunit